VATNPSIAYLHRKVEERTVESEFGPLLDTLGLAPEVLAQLRSLLVERQVAMDGASDAAYKAGFAMDRDRYLKALKESASASEYKMEALIGPGPMPSLEKVFQLGPSNLEVQRFISPMMDFAAAPLSNDQALRLAAAIGDLVDANTNSIAITDPAEEQLVAKAAQFLSPTQLNVLRERRLELAAFGEMRKVGTPR
jgi:hypothetical protein